MQKRSVSVILIISIAFLWCSYFKIPVSMSASPRVIPQINIPKIESFPRMPAPYAYMNWKQRTLDYDAFVTDWSQTSQFWTIRNDTTHYNMNSSTISMPSYYGDRRQLTDGHQEAAVIMAMVLGSTLAGRDMTNYGGRNYVGYLETFYHNHQNYPNRSMFYNNPIPGSGHGDWWYDSFPSVLAAAISYKYPNVSWLSSKFYSTADELYRMIGWLGGSPTGIPNFYYKAFDHDNRVPVSGSHICPEAGITTALTSYWAFKRWGAQQHLDAAKWAMKYYENTQDNPYYEVGMVFGPYLAARLNAEQGTNYNVQKMFDWLLTTNSNARAGWGTIQANWNGYDVYGIQGSSTDNAGGQCEPGYGFSMNTFATAYLAPAVKYDHRYAKAVGKFLLNVSNAARFFYPDQMPSNKQSHGSSYISSREKVIPYEGLRKSESGQSPRATGDPSRYGSQWGLHPDTKDLSLYSGSWVGLFGAIFNNTNVDRILQIDCNALDAFSETSFPTYLYYNPYSTSQSVQITLGAAVDLFNVLTGEYIAKNVTGTQTFSISADSAVLLVVAPANSLLAYSGSKTLINNVTVAYEPNKNIALNKSVSASSVQESGCEAYRAVDGNAGTRWASQYSDPQWLSIDLGSKFSISRVILNWEAAYGKAYKIQVSNNGSSWIDVYSTSSGDGGIDEINITPVDARYIRMYGTQRGTQYGYSLYELEVYGNPVPEQPPATNIALNKPVSVSSIQEAGCEGQYAVDGNTGTRWASRYSDPQWIRIDLGQNMNIGKVILNWEAAYGKAYKIQVSNNGTSWTDVYSTSSGDGGIDEINITPVNTRYVRMYGTQRGTQYGYSLYEFEVYGQ